MVSLILHICLLPPLVTAPLPAAMEARAEDAAVQVLIDRVLQQRLAGGGTLARELAASPDAERTLRELIVAVHEHGEAREADGAVLMEAWIPAEGLVQVLEQVRRQHFPRSSSERLALPAGTTTVVGTGCVPDDGLVRDGRLGWRHCTPEQAQLASATALIDLRQAVVARLAELRLPGQRTVSQQLSVRFRLDEAVRRRVAELQAGDPTYTPSGLCLRTIRLTRTEVVRLLVAAAEESPERLDVDLSEVVHSPMDDPLQVQGCGVAPLPAPASRPSNAR